MLRIPGPLCRPRADPEKETEELVAVLRRWSALLRAGLPADRAWAEVARTVPACARPRPGCCLHHRVRRRAARERLGLDAEVPCSDVGGSADRAGRRPWRRLPGRAAPPDPGWELVDTALTAGRRAGAAPAAIAAHLADTLEAAVDAARARRSAAAGPRATARLLQWLPMGGLGMAWLLGTSPADLLTSPFGWIIGVLGLLFTLAGQAWTRLLVARATRPTGSIEPAVVLDLVAPLLAAGRSLTAALDDLARALPDAHALRAVTALLRWGRPWEEAWEPVAQDPLWTEVAAWLRPLHRSGMAGARALTETAAAVRQQSRRADERAAEELAVRLVVPLSLCLLPAFVCWGVIPMVIALLTAGP